MKDRVELGSNWIEMMLDDARRQEVATVIRQDEFDLYKKAALQTGFSIEISALPGQEHQFDVTGDDEFSDGRRMTREGELVIEILAPEGLKGCDYSVFWQTHKQLELEQEAQSTR